jgi:hypothetical protein
VKRPFTALSVLGVAAHNIFELGAGVGLVLQPQLGLRGAGAFWAITLPAMLAAMNRWERPRAFLLGSNLAGVAVHFALWPVDWRKVPPSLTDAEGMGSRALPWYNILLYAWLGVTAVALATETRRRRWALAGLLAVLPLRAGAAHHFRWLAEQARSRPAWWNRAVASKL